MQIEKITWKTMLPPILPSDFPCMVCREAVAEYRRTIHRNPVDVLLSVCSECATKTDSELWLAIIPQNDV